MSITDRDKRIVLVLVPLLVLIGYWFLLLAPKREEASNAGAALAKQEQRRDAAQQRVNALASSKRGFASDYAELVRLGKAVPSSVDMPSLIVQLDTAARGTGIAFSRIATGERTSAAPAQAATPPKAPGSGNGSQPAAAGGQPAASAPGQAAEAAGNGTNAANASSAEKSGVAPADTQTSGQAREGSLPVGGGAAAAGTKGAGAAGAPGLETVPLELEFKGNFFNLADFFHRLKRFVRAANDRVLVRGRLLTIDSLKFSSEPELFPKLMAEVTATVYLSPKAGGSTAGATPQGPATTPPAGSSSPAPAGSSSAPAGTPPTSPAPASTQTP